MTRKTKGIVRPDFSRERDRKLDLSQMFADGMATQAIDADGGPGKNMADVRLLPLDLIDHNPYQARQTFDVDALEELASSIREHGVIEPIVVRAAEGDEGRYEIVAGERRYRAAIMAEQDAIPARIMELDARQASIITALENLQREDLDIEDEARQFAYLCEALDVSQRELARMLGKNHVYIARRIRLLKRPDLLEEYRAGRLMLLQATALAGTGEDETADAGDAEGPADESVSRRNTLPQEPGETREAAQGELELLEREDLPGYVVRRAGESATESPRSARSAAARANSANRRPLFRWRPVQQFYNWVGRTHVADVPSDERATLKVQLTEIKDALEKQIAELEQLEGGGSPPEERRPEEESKDKGDQPFQTTA